MANRRALALCQFLSGFEVGTEYSSNAVRVQMSSDESLRIVWESNGPDDVDCGIALFYPHGGFISRGISHVWNDAFISTFKESTEGVAVKPWEKISEENPLNFDESMAETIRQWLGCF